MTYEMAVLAALVQLKNPGTQSIVAATGISERKVQDVIRALETAFDIKISRVKNGNRYQLQILGWGVFEQGVAIRQKLLSIDLDHFKSSRVASKEVRQKMKSTTHTTPSTPMTNLTDKKQYFDRVKLNHYRESMRLEGLNSSYQTLPTSKQERDKLRQSLINKYAKKSRQDHLS